MSEEVKVERKKRSLSLIQPTSIPTLGNYLGAMKGWSAFQEEYDTIYGVADLHSITVRQDPQKLRRQTTELYAMLLALGLDPDKGIVFIQSHVPQHAELSWVLGCYTQFGELSRMTQFKDKSAKHADNINAGLFTYPVLMAADILLYQTDVVPVGIDQKQHVELARNIADRFNQLYPNTFTSPEALIPTSGAKIMSLADPTKKMSKSDENENAVVRILDDRDTVIRKFRRAVTDSDSEVRRGDGKEGVGNLMTIYSCVTGKTDAEIEREFDGRGYADFKLAVGEAVADRLAPVREEYARLLADKGYLEEVMKKGAAEASYYARKTLTKVRRKLGFVTL